VREVNVSVFFVILAGVYFYRTCSLCTQNLAKSEEIFDQNETQLNAALTVTRAQRSFKPSTAHSTEHYLTLPTFDTTSDRSRILPNSKAIRSILDDICRPMHSVNVECVWCLRAVRSRSIQTSTVRRSSRLLGGSPSQSFKTR